jgi:beta-glucosidase
MKKIIKYCFIAPCLLTALLLLSQARTLVPLMTGNARVDELISKMTLEEKVSMIHGAPEPAETSQGQAGYIPGVPRLGIPPVRLTDGPHGVVVKSPSTGMVGTIGLAATWSRKDAREHGEAIGRDARLLGQDVVLEPFVNLWRDITYMRGSNTYGEDPYLVGQIGVGMVKGIQSQNVMAQVKHYIANDAGENVYLDDQTLHELYLAPFATAADAGAASMMCAYNKVNGTYICGNCDANNHILRDEMKYEGFMTSDWGATHGTEFINCGEDLEMPGASDNPSPGGTGLAGMMSSYFNLAAPSKPAGNAGPGAMPPPMPGGDEDNPMMAMMMGGAPEEKIEGQEIDFDAMMAGMRNNPEAIGMKKAIELGLIKIETIDKAVGRILVMMDKFGWLEKAPSHKVNPINYEANVPTLRQTAIDAAVLLKNAGGALPLQTTDLSSLALIGPGAGQTIATEGGGEMSVGLAPKQIGTYQIMKQLAPSAKITYAVANDMTGKAIPVSALSHDGKPGLLRTDSNGTTSVDNEISFTTSRKTALPAGGKYTWTGKLNIPTDGSYQINIQLLGTTGILRIDGKRINGIADMTGNMHGETVKAGSGDVMPSRDGLCNLRSELKLTAGQHDLKITSVADASGDPVQIQLAWVTPEDKKANYDAAITAAKNSKTAVVFIWSRGKPFFNGLPGDQEKLINDITSVNPNTIVVINSQHPFAMPWLGKVKAVLDMWFPGDEGGWATANILLGKASPAGRLPVSWIKNLNDNIGSDLNHPERSAKGVDGKTTFTEGLNIGYRYYESEKKDVLFPFGYGLTYSSFEYSGIKAFKAPDEGLNVSFTLKNKGKFDSDEVPQVYIDAPKQAPDGIKFAVKALAGFERVSLKAGETRTITVHVPVLSFEYWSTTESKWKRATGTRTIHVGASSKDFRLSSDINI